MKIKKILTALTVVEILSYILVLLLSYKQMQTTNITGNSKTVFAVSLMATAVLNLAVTVISGIQLKKERDRAVMAVFIINSLIITLFVILFIAGYMFWRAQA